MNKRRNLSPNLLHQAKKSKIQEVPEFLSSNKKNQLVDRNPRRAGDYILGPEISTGPVDCISHYLARRQGTREFYQLKVLFLSFYISSYFCFHFFLNGSLSFLLDSDIRLEKRRQELTTRENSFAFRVPAVESTKRCRQCD